MIAMKTMFFNIADIKYLYDVFAFSRSQYTIDTHVKLSWGANLAKLDADLVV